MGIANNLAARIRQLEKRGEMYIQPFTYDGLVAYLDGYDAGRVDLGEESELDAFRDWLHSKVGHHCSLHWAAVIRTVFAGGGKEEFAKQRLFELFDEFMQSANIKANRRPKRQQVVSES